MTTETLHHPTYINVPEAVGVFDDVDALQAAIYDLMAVGFTRYDISLLAREDVLREKLGRFYWRSEELEDNPEAPRAPFVSDAAVGALEASLLGGFFYVGSAVAMAAMLTPVSTLLASVAAIAIGGAPAAVIGALLARREGKRHEDYYAEQLHHGGILLWVRTSDAEKEEVAVRILEGHSGRDVHVHPWSE